MYVYIPVGAACNIIPLACAPIQRNFIVVYMLGLTEYVISSHTIKPSTVCVYSKWKASLHVVICAYIYLHSKLENTLSVSMLYIPTHRIPPVAHIVPQI